MALPEGDSGVKAINMALENAPGTTMILLENKRRGRKTRRQQFFKIYRANCQSNQRPGPYRILF
jgi:hypothetical protein